MIRIGTSGYNHRDWIGSFYPPEMGPARYLARYADELDLCELGGAVHRLPAPQEAERILGESEGRLLFTALAPRRLVAAAAVGGAGWRGGGKDQPDSRGTTDRDVPHGDAWGERFPAVGAGFLASEGGSEEIAGRDYAPARGTRDESARAPSADSGRWAEMDRLVARLRDGLLPYARAKRFGGLVLPLPRAVAATEEVLAAVGRIADRLEELPLLVEPRDPSWAEECALGTLRGIGAGLVLADGPGAEGPALGPDRGRPRPLPARRLVPFAPVTAEIAYVRFHGRDGEMRWAGGAARRDYLYSWEELVAWLPALRVLASRARELHIVFNNPWRGRAIENARMMRRLIGFEDDARPRRRRAVEPPGTDASGPERERDAGPNVFHREPNGGAPRSPNVFHEGSTRGPAEDRSSGPNGFHSEAGEGSRPDHWRQSARGYGDEEW